jgi:hypothetical protein
MAGMRDKLTHAYFGVARRIEKGTYLVTVNQEDFGITKSYNLAIAVDNKGYIWLSFVDPYPIFDTIRILVKDH